MARILLRNGVKAALDNAYAFCHNTCLDVALHELRKLKEEMRDLCAEHFNAFNTAVSETMAHYLETLIESKFMTSVSEESIAFNILNAASHHSLRDRQALMEMAQNNPQIANGSMGERAHLIFSRMPNSIYEALKACQLYTGERWYSEEYIQAFLRAYVPLIKASERIAYVSEHKSIFPLILKHRLRAMGIKKEILHYCHAFNYIPDLTDQKAIDAKNRNLSKKLFTMCETEQLFTDNKQYKYRHFPYMHNLDLIIKGPGVTGEDMLRMYKFVIPADYYTPDVALDKLNVRLIAPEKFLRTYSTQTPKIRGRATQTYSDAKHGLLRENYAIKTTSKPSHIVDTVFSDRRGSFDESYRMRLEDVRSIMGTFQIGWAKAISKFMQISYGQLIDNNSTEELIKLNDAIADRFGNILEFSMYQSALTITRAEHEPIASISNDPYAPPRYTY